MELECGCPPLLSCVLLLNRIASLPGPAAWERLRGKGGGWSGGDSAAGGSSCDWEAWGVRLEEDWRNLVLYLLL